MGRSRKPKKSDDDEAMDDMGVSEKEDEPVVKKPKTHFTALLRNGVTYEFEGMVFSRGIPKQVEMKYLKKFETNGWFTITK